MRASEMASLITGSFELSNSESVVKVDRSATKNSKGAIIPLRAETADSLAKHLHHMTPSAKAFNVPSSLETADMLRADLADASIEFRNEAGEVLDFHALRHTCGSWLAADGVHPKIIQRIMRHSTITLTMDRYTHAFKADESAAVAKLPSLDVAAKAVAATGTHGEISDKVDSSHRNRASEKDHRLAGRISGCATG